MNCRAQNCGNCRSRTLKTFGKDLHSHLEAEVGLGEIFRGTFSLPPPTYPIYIHAFYIFDGGGDTGDTSGQNPSAACHRGRGIGDTVQDA